MGYSIDPQMVRVDFFKPGGKWYTTESIKWLAYSGEKSIHAIFRESVKAAVNDRYKGMWAICLTPYHENEHPLMIRLV